MTASPTRPMPPAAMTSCRERTLERSRTLAQLRAAGIRDHAVHLSECRPGSPEAINAGMRAAMTIARQDHPGRGLLLVEDDLELAPDFPWHLRQALELDHITYLFLIDTPQRLALHHGPDLAARILAGGPVPRGPTRLLTAAAPFGTQCVLIPERLAATVAALADPPGPAALDTRLAAWLRRHPEEPAYTTLPHPVQHLNARAGADPTAARIERRSASYGLPTV